MAITWTCLDLKYTTLVKETLHYNDVIMNLIASQITSLTVVYSTVYSDADQRKHQSSASLAFVRGIHRGPMNSPHKVPVTRKMFPLDDVIMWCVCRFDYDDDDFKIIMSNINTNFRANPLYTLANTIPGVLNLAMFFSTVRCKLTNDPN